MAATPTPTSLPVHDAAAQKPTGSFLVKIQRQDGPDQPSYWQTFEVPRLREQNMTSVLQWIAAHPVTTDGKQVHPPVWEASCLEEVCGSCTMLINGHVRQACSTLVDDVMAGIVKGQPDLKVRKTNQITLAPMTKFPVVRDLWVDRARMFEDLKRIKGWVPIDGTYDAGPGPKESPEQQEFRYALSRCMTCGCCLEACPQYQKDNHFVGPFIFAQTLLFNLHETGKELKEERLDVMASTGGINDCGQAQNCVKVCPKEVPITEAIAHIGRQTTLHEFKKFFRGK